MACTLVGAPALPVFAAAETSGTSLFGNVPQSVRSSATQVVSEKVGGDRVSSLPTPSDGRFRFVNLSAGDYVVRVLDASGTSVIESDVARVQPDAAVEVHFDESRTPAAAVFGTAGHSGISKTAVILSGALVAGVTTAVVLVSNGDSPRPASPSR